MDKENKTYFTKQNRKEKESKLFQIFNNKLELIVWEKGKSSRFSFSCLDFNKENLQLVITSEKHDFSGINSVLYTFTFNGVNYFGKGELKEINAKRFRLECSDDLFKSERRENFRLLTYPHHMVYLQFPQEEEEVQSENKVVSFQTGQSQTGLFKNFLNLVGSDEDSGVLEGYVRYRVLDISVTGLAFMISELEKETLEKQNEIGPIKIDFTEEIEIPMAEIRYIIPMLNKNIKSYKVGIQFKDVDLNTDQLLGRLINDTMRDFETEFEDFLK